MEEGENIHIIKNMYIERMVCKCRQIDKEEDNMREKQKERERGKQREQEADTDNTHRK